MVGWTTNPIRHDITLLTDKFLTPFMFPLSFKLELPRD